MFRAVARFHPMPQVCELHFDSFNLYFLQSLSSEELSELPAPDSPDAYSRMGRSWKPVLELTHNHGTENDPSFSHHNGNTEPKVYVSPRLYWMFADLVLKHSAWLTNFVNASLSGDKDGRPDKIAVCVRAQKCVWYRSDAADVC